MVLQTDLLMIFQERVQFDHPCLTKLQPPILPGRFSWSYFIIQHYNAGSYLQEQSLYSPGRMTPTAQSTGPVCRNTTAQNSCKRPVQSWVEADQERWYISMLSWGCLLYWKTRSVVNRLGRNFSKLSSRVMRSTTHENCEEKITMFILYFLI